MFGEHAVYIMIQNKKMLNVILYYNIIFPTAVDTMSANDKGSKILTIDVEHMAKHILQYLKN